MNTPLKPLILAVVTALSCASAQAQLKVQTTQQGTPNLVIEVFRLSNQQIGGVSSAGATEYVVDTLAEIKAQLSAGLPGVPQAAQRIVTQRMQKLVEADPDKKMIRAASTAVVRAAEYKITKVPAIVFDGRAVVYGVADVAQARAIYRNWAAQGGLR